MKSRKRVAFWRTRSRRRLKMNGLRTRRFSVVVVPLRPVRIIRVRVLTRGRRRKLVLRSSRWVVRLRSSLSCPLFVLRCRLKRLILVITRFLGRSLLCRIMILTSRRIITVAMIVYGRSRIMLFCIMIGRVIRLTWLLDRTRIARRKSIVVPIIILRPVPCLWRILARRRRSTRGTLVTDLSSRRKSLWTLLSDTLQ